MKSQICIIIVFLMMIPLFVIKIKLDISGETSEFLDALLIISIRSIIMLQKLKKNYDDCNHVKLISNVCKKKKICQQYYNIIQTNHSNTK